MENSTQDEIVKSLNAMTITEIVALTKRLETEWGVSATPQAAPSKQEPDTKQEVQTEFTVMLTSVPADKKIAVIKAMRDILSIGLKESKDFCEAAPKMVKDQLSADDAAALKAKLVEAGAVVEIK